MSTDGRPSGGGLGRGSMGAPGARVSHNGHTHKVSHPGQPPHGRLSHTGSVGRSSRPSPSAAAAAAAVAAATEAATAMMSGGVDGEDRPSGGGTRGMGMERQGSKLAAAMMAAINIDTSEAVRVQQGRAQQTLAKMTSFQKRR